MMRIDFMRQKGRLIPAALICCWLVFFTPLRTISAEPIQLNEKDFNGAYIGKQIEYLCERELFEYLSSRWMIAPVFKQKMLSGKLHSDQNIAYQQTLTPTGYQARLKSRSANGPESIVQWGIEDIRAAALDEKFKPIQKRIFFLNFVPHAYWLRFKIHNPAKEAAELVLECDKHFFSTMDLFMPAGHKIILKHSDFIQGMTQREIDYKNLSLRLKVPPGVTPYYLRIESTFADIVPLRIWTEPGFDKHVLADTAILAIITGILIFITGFTLIAFIFIRDLSYLYLALMTGCALCIHLSFSGFGFQFLWPDDPQWSVNGLFFGLPLSFVFFFLFCRSFLEIPKLTPKYDKFIRGMVVFYATGVIWGGLLSQPFRSYMLAFFIFSEFCFYLPMLFPAVASVKKGHRAGLYVLIGISFYFFAALKFAFSSLDILPFQMINYINLKGFSFSIIMALALFHKVNQLKNALADANNDLEKKVHQRTLALADANARLKALDTLKTNFFANISHELRTPLTLILAPLDSFLNGDYGHISKTRQYIFESMQRNASRLLRLINSLLDFSKIEAGKMAVNKRECFLSEMITDCILHLQSLADKENIHIAFEDRSRNSVLAVDPDLMEKAIFNLLSNAVKFNRSPGNVWVTLQKEGRHLVLMVKDSGVGIPESCLETIFERFSQVDASATRKYAGTGIGLSLVKEIVLMHSGKIDVESKPGHGSIFTIRLPIGLIAPGPTAFDPDSVAPAMIQKNRPSLDSQPGGHAFKIETPHPSHRSAEDAATILIVEDNVDMCRYLSELLQKKYQTITAADGKAALAVMEQREVDLVLADVMMPEMDGFELVQKIRCREKYEDLPVVMLSARSDTLDRITGIEKGANDYLTKPFSSEELLARINSQLKFKQLRQKICAIAIKQKNRDKPLTDETKLKIEKVKVFLEQNYADDISRDDLAAAIDISPDHLGRMFKKYTGRKIAAYLGQIRVEAAAQKLLQSDDKIIDIAFEVGFGSLRTFNKKFIEVMGMSPSDYKKQ